MDSLGESGQPQENAIQARFDGAEQKILEGHRQAVEKRIANLAVQSLMGGNKQGLVNGDKQSDSVGQLSLSSFYDPEELLHFDGNKEEPTAESDDSERDKIEAAMRRLIAEEITNSAREYFGLKKAIENDQLMLRIAENQARAQVDTGMIAKGMVDVVARQFRPGEPTSNNESMSQISENQARAQVDTGISTRSEITDAIRNNIDKKQSQLRDLPTRSPESHVVVHGYDFRNLIEEIRHHEIATTPYVADHLNQLEQNMNAGRPTFVHGHLGSGKTELAIMAAKRSTISHAAYEAAQTELKKFQEDKPTAPKAECRNFFGRTYRENVAKFKAALYSGDNAANERFSPLIISGSKDLTIRDLYADKTLKLTKFNGKPLLEHKEDLDNEITAWMAAHPEAKDKPDVIKDETNKIIELYKLKNQAFGTEVETIKQAIYRGVEEGRPVIIDEANAIPAAILISMNDILQRRPGESCYIPGVGETKIKEGFSITMTGNLSSGRINYIGTEELNPAALSRLSVIEHDYLPMSDTDPNYREQADPEKNELFMVMIASLAERTGDLRLPEMDKSLDKLFKLAQLAHATQLVFEGKWRESNMNITLDSGDPLDPNLKKSVLSIRNLLNVLENWDKGSEKNLDKALWDSFISNIIDPDDQNFVLALAKRYGFFQEDDGWQIRIKERGTGSTSLAQAHPDEFWFERKPLETMSLRDVVDVLYGERPDRMVYPEIDLDELEENMIEDLSPAELAEVRFALRDTEKTINALDKLGEQFGCNKEEAEQTS